VVYPLRARVRHARAIAAELHSYLDTDVTGVLPAIRVPTLVLVDTDAFYEVPRGPHSLGQKAASLAGEGHFFQVRPTATLQMFPRISRSLKVVENEPRCGCPSFDTLAA